MFEPVPDKRSRLHFPNHCHVGTCTCQRVWVTFFQEYQI